MPPNPLQHFVEAMEALPERRKQLQIRSDNSYASLLSTLNAQHEALTSVVNRLVDQVASLSNPLLPPPPHTPDSYQHQHHHFHQIPTTTFTTQFQHQTPFPPLQWPPPPEPPLPPPPPAILSTPLLPLAAQPPPEPSLAATTFKTLVSGNTSLPPSFLRPSPPPVNIPPVSPHSQLSQNIHFGTPPPSTFKSEISSTPNLITIMPKSSNSDKQNFVDVLCLPFPACTAKPILSFNGFYGYEQFQVNREPVRPPPPPKPPDQSFQRLPVASQVICEPSRPPPEPPDRNVKPPDETPRPKFTHHASSTVDLLWSSHVPSDQHRLYANNPQPHDPNIPFISQSQPYTTSTIRGKGLEPIAAQHVSLYYLRTPPKLLSSPSFQRQLYPSCLNLTPTQLIFQRLIVFLPIRVHSMGQQLLPAHFLTHVSAMIQRPFHALSNARSINFPSGSAQHVFSQTHAIHAFAFYVFSSNGPLMLQRLFQPCPHVLPFFKSNYPIRFVPWASQFTFNFKNTMLGRFLQLRNRARLNYVRTLKTRFK